MATLVRFQQKFGRALLAGALGFTTIVMNGCDAIYWDEQASLAQVQQKNEIIVLTTKSPLIYSKSKRGDGFGIDFDLLDAFARSYNIKLKFVTLPDEESVLRALSNGEGDIAAARLRTPARSHGFLIGPAYEETHLSLYCHRKHRIQNIQDLNKRKVLILSKDNYQGLSQRLAQLSPQVEVEVVDNMKAPELLSQIQENRAACAIAENFAGDFYSRYHQRVEKITSLTEPHSLSWVLTPDNQELLNLMHAWFQKASRNDEVMRVLDRYRSYLAQLDQRDISRFLKMIRSTLPAYRKDFKKAAQAHKLPWQLVASVAYQESHWNPEAISFTGVRGVMQLTLDTAAFVGIEDRTDPQQSIWGGSKYLRYLLNKMPADLNSKDRLALALAAYNIGYAHLRDAQTLAEEMGLNPHSWHHLRNVLPLLANPQYANKLKYGPARGYETVDFVERVKSFYNLMNVAS